MIIVRKGVQKIFKQIYRGLEAIAAISTVLMMFTIVANATSRTIFNAPIAGTTEHVKYWYMPLLALLGFAISERKRSHTRTNIVFRKMGATVQRTLVIGSALLLVTTYAVLAYFGLGEALDAYRYRATGGVMGTVMWPLLFVVPFAFALMVVQAVINVPLEIAEVDNDRSTTTD